MTVVVDSLVSATLPHLGQEASGNHRIMGYPELERTHKVHQLQLLVLHGSPLQISLGCKWEDVGQDRDLAIVGTGQSGDTDPCRDQTPPLLLGPNSPGCSCHPTRPSPPSWLT